MLFFSIAGEVVTIQLSTKIYSSPKSGRGDFLVGEARRLKEFRHHAIIDSRTNLRQKQKSKALK